MFGKGAFPALSLALLATGSSAHRGHSKRTTPALNPIPEYNTISNNGGPRLYYNGTGDVPSYDQLSPIPAPITPYPSQAQVNAFMQEIAAINSNGSYFNTSCAKCVATTEVLHLAAVTQSVQAFTNLVIAYCQQTGFSVYAVNCFAEFSPQPMNVSAYSSGAAGIGPWWAQLYAKMSLATGDMQAWCHYNFDTCAAPPVITIDESQYFKPAPSEPIQIAASTGETFPVLHISDWHLDPRYDIGSESNCTGYLCCRPYSTNTKLNTGVNNASIPASRFGSLKCDAPADLAISAFTEMDKFINPADFSFAIFTGDIVSHDNDDQISRAYVEYEEKITYETFKAHMGNVPIYATLGNHDNNPEAYSTPNNINDGTANQNQMSWDYDLLSGLWQQYGWITGSEANYASTHYGGYAHTTAQGLRIISINTDFWYVDNVYNYYNFTNPDVSGTLAWLANELTQCEEQGQPAWIIGHVLSGYDGTNGLPNPTALFYSIVRRFSVSGVLREVFFGHTHEDQLQIFYDYTASSILANGQRNTTDVDYTKPLMVSWIGPSITPLSGLNAGYVVLHVDSKTFHIQNQQTYFANISNSLEWDTPVWEFEYDTRATYNVGAVNWPQSAPLNATFWNSVTDQMLRNQSLVETYNFLETKSSTATKGCTSTACGAQKVCYIRSGSAALGSKCPQDDGPY